MIDRWPETLIVGGLTIDRFGDGRSAPGGSVIHSGRAAVAEGSAAAFLTVAGDEPEARAGLRTLADLGTLIHQPARATTTYAHDERDGRRVLRLEAASDAISADARLPDLTGGRVAGTDRRGAAADDDRRPPRTSRGRR